MDQIKSLKSGYVLISALSILLIISSILMIGIINSRSYQSKIERLVEENKMMRAEYEMAYLSLVDSTSNITGVTRINNKKVKIDKNNHLYALEIKKINNQKYYIVSQVYS